MTVQPVRRDRRADRHQATRREILDAAWDNARERGVADLSLREVAAVVGMRGPSLYVYFPSKAAVYDEMFAGGYRALLEMLEGVDGSDRAPRGKLVAGASAYIDFCTADPARFQLLFERPVPGFVPSEQSYAAAVAVLDLTRARLARAGVTSKAGLDLWTALTTGLASQQIANDPGGRRWRRLVPSAVDMFLAHAASGRGR